MAIRPDSSFSEPAGLLPSKISTPKNCCSRPLPAGRSRNLWNTKMKFQKGRGTRGARHLSAWLPGSPDNVTQRLPCFFRRNGQERAAGCKCIGEDFEETCIRCPVGISYRGSLHRI